VTITQPSWVFGYGSLIWKQDFPYLESRPGRITGWARRFWQGSHDHRGLEHDPGRVVTLVATPGEHCYGRAFLVEPEVFEHLDHREKNGYERIAVEITFESGGVNGIVYRARRAMWLSWAPRHRPKWRRRSTAAQAPVAPIANTCSSSPVSYAAWVTQTNMYSRSSPGYWRIS
jgi:cation transport protein ChaC